MTKHPDCDVLMPSSGLAIYHRGPKLTKGKLPAFFYFALSGEESLMVDPFNQPILPLLQDFRVFSFTLPLHTPGYNPSYAVANWAKTLAEEPKFIDNFISQCAQNVEYLINEGLVDETSIVVGGLSRGCFIALHLAAKVPEIKHIVGFAPMTKIKAPKELEEDAKLSKTLERLDVIHLASKLWDRNIRLYIGNRDILVHTEYCFQLVEQLANTAFEHGIRSSPFELIIGPSIGYKGHGTAPSTFAAGAEWIYSQ